MLALQGYYENGKLNLPENAPTKGKVYVIFTEENSREKINISDLQLFEKFSGSVKSDIDIYTNGKNELEEGLMEKYASID